MAAQRGLRANGAASAYNPPKIECLRILERNNYQITLISLETTVVFVPTHFTL